MSNVNTDNSYYEEWYNNTEKWLKQNGYVINPNENEKFTCPRCGKTKIINKKEIRKSQFGYKVCIKCYEDEIIKDSLGVDQLETSEWFIFSKQNCG